MRDLRWAIAGLVVGTTLLSGCSERVEANDTLPSTSASPTTDALPPIGPPDLPMPADARERTPEGAQAFTEYYVALYNHAIRTLDTTYLRDLSNGCDTCEELSDQVDSVAAKGQAIDGGQVRIVGSTSPYISGDEAQLVFDIAQEPLALTAGGAPVEGMTFPAFSTAGGGGSLRWSAEDESWTFTQWTWPE